MLQKESPAETRKFQTLFLGNWSNIMELNFSWLEIGMTMLKSTPWLKFLNLVPAAD